MHPHLKESRDIASSKIRKLSGSHGTMANPSGNKPAPMALASGPQKAVGLKAEGGKGKQSIGRFARGGRTKSKGTNVNVIVAPGQGGQPPAAPAMPPAQPMAAAPAPKPPMPPMPPPGMGAGMGGPGMPPGMPGLPRKRGGRVAKFTGGAASGVGRLEKAEHQARK